MLKEDLSNISILDLYESNKISARAYTSCCNAQFKSLYEIVSYFNQGHSFNDIRNAGRKTCEELECLCKSIIPQIINFESPEPISNEKNEECESRFEFNTSQKVLLQNKYYELINECSVRTFNCLNKLSVEEFAKYYLNCSIKELYNIKNIGKKSIEEIVAFRIKLTSFIDELKSIETSPLLYIKLDAIDKYGNLCENDFIIDFYKKNNHLPMLWILEQHLKNVNSREISILLSSYNIIKDQPHYTLDELAVQHGLSRERIRQIRNVTFLKTFAITNETVDYKRCDLTNIRIILQHSSDWSYLLDKLKNDDIVCQESFEIQNYLKEENSNFSFEFVLYIIAYIFRDRYSLLGDIDVTNKSNNWDSSFIVKKEYSDIFDFEKLRIEFSDILMDNDSEYLLDIEEYVANSPCWIKYDYNKNDSIISIVRDILLYEFHLYSDGIDGQIKIPANKERKPIDVIYEILQKTGKPMHINEIFEEFKIILPEHKYTEASQLRPYLQKHDAISYRNRNSVYMLKEWDHIKTGTIRDAIVEFLIENDLPQTVDDITEYVLQYFPDTNVSSIRTSMLIDTPKRFSYFNNNKFGLNNKEYPPEYEICEQQEVMRRSFEQRLLDLELFIVEEEHFPFTTSDNSKESSLGRWWYRIINNKQNITESQQAEVERVKAKYSGFDTDKTTYDWHINYNKLKCFILENRCLPSARGDEKFLYGWFQRAKADFHHNRLTEEQRLKFVNLAKLI